MKLRTNNIKTELKGGLHDAFTRLDLIVTLCVIVLLSSWFVSIRFGERGRIIRCASNLMTLGKAMNEYAANHDDSLPAAGINLKSLQSSWDIEILACLASGVAKGNEEKLAKTVPHLFACPSDKITRRTTVRSYAMGGNDMAPENWPPSRDSATGVGLRWDNQTVTSLLDEDVLKTPAVLPKLKRSSIPAPSDTVLLTEFIDPNNTLGSIWQTAVFGTSQQQQIFKDGVATFHQGRFNYLMVDGHVERLSPLQTGAFDGTAGIWSIKKGN